MRQSLVFEIRVCGNSLTELGTRRTKPETVKMVNEVGRYIQTKIIAQ